ncbi:MAG: hypothetical protein ACMXYL_03640 [Candidatus Woesearchaeota archaeon]
MGAKSNGTIPIEMVSGLEYASTTKEYFSMLILCNKSVAEKAVNEGLRIRNGIGNIAIPMRKDVRKNYYRIRAEEKAYGNGEIDCYMIANVPGILYGKMRDRIIKQSNDNFSSNGTVDTVYPVWNKIVDRMLLYQSNIITPMSLKGYVSLDDYVRFGNHRFDPYDWYIGE